MRALFRADIRRREKGPPVPHRRSGRVAPSFLLWGDSPRRRDSAAVAAAAARAGRVGLFAGWRSLSPLLGVTTPSPIAAPSTTRWRRWRSGREITEIILESRWRTYAEGSTYGISSLEAAFVLPTTCAALPSRRQSRLFLRGLDRTVSELRKEGKKVVNRRLHSRDRVGRCPNTRAPLPWPRMRMGRSRCRHLSNRQEVCAECLHEPAAALRLRTSSIRTPFWCRSGAGAVALNGVPSIATNIT